MISTLFNRFALRIASSKSDVPLKFGFNKKEISVLWRFSFPAALSSALVGPANWMCNVMLVNQSAGYGEMGIYNAAIQWNSIIIFLPALMSQVFLPLMTEIENSGKSINSRSVFLLNVVLNSIVGIATVA